jgi:hypothetical protein
VPAPVATATDAEWRHHGAPFALSEVTPASAVLASPAERVGQALRVEGRLTEVCQKKGCWVVLADDAGHTLRVTMKDHAFGVLPTDGGRTAQVEGSVIAKAVDPTTEEHYRSEGAGAAPSAAGFEMVATGVAVRAI